MDNGDNQYSSVLSACSAMVYDAYSVSEPELITKLKELYGESLDLQKTLCFFNDESRTIKPQVRKFYRY